MLKPIKLIKIESDLHKKIQTASTRDVCLGQFDSGSNDANLYGLDFKKTNCEDGVSGTDLLLFARNRPGGWTLYYSLDVRTNSVGEIGTRGGVSQLTSICSGTHINDCVLNLQGNGPVIRWK